MNQLWETLGYTEIVHSVAEGLSDDDGLDLIEGPPGVGKSWIARGVGSLWQDGGGSVIVAEGDDARSDFCLYPFGFALSELGRGWKAIRGGATATALAAEGLLGTGGLLTTTVQTLAKSKQDRQRQKLQYLGDKEREVLSDLERLSSKKPTLLIADNLHWWDRDSLAFLSSLLDPRIRDALPFVGTLRILAVQTPPPYQSVAHKEAHAALLAASYVNRIVVGRVPQHSFRRTLVALGAPDATDEKTADLIYTFSGGHLALASRAATRLAENRTEFVGALSESDAFLRRLITQRVLAMGELGEKAVEVLRTAATLGLAFRREEAFCAATTTETETARILRFCRDENLLIVDDNVCSFSHDLFRQFFLESGLHNQIDIHLRLMECLRLLRPAEYGVRSTNAVKAERAHDAGVLAVHAALQRIREGKKWSDALGEIVLAALDNGECRQAVGVFATAHRQIHAQRFRECLATLERLPRDLNESLAAEADYYRAMCLMSTRSEADRATGRALLAPWAGFEEHEPEVGIRLATLRLYGLGHMIDKEPGRELEAQIRRTLVKRVAFDKSSEDDLYTLDRCAGSLYEPDIALVRNREAVRHFAPANGQTMPRRPVEYYRALTNLGANLIANGRYADAEKVHGQLEQFVQDYGPSIFPRLEFAKSNAILAEFRSGRLDPTGAAYRQREVCDAMGPDGDPYYPYNALAVYMAMTGEYTQAIVSLDQLSSNVRKLHQPEPSMVYMLQSNLTLVRFLRDQDIYAATKDWEGLSELVQRIAYVTRPYHVRRHELILAALPTALGITAPEFDMCILRSHPHEFGPFWNHLAHVFQTPEVEFWREN